MSTNVNTVIEALRKVIHPEKEKDIISLDMISGIEIAGKNISFTLQFQKLNDPFQSSIKKSCIQAILKYVAHDAQIEVIIKLPEKQAIVKSNPLSGVKNCIAIASGKGGVGKSTVSVNLAIALTNSGFKVGLIDADIFGPSIPMMFGLEDTKPELRQEGDKFFMIPIEKYGVKVLSIGFFIKPETAMMWRGPMATSALRQFLEEAIWGELDYMIFDLPPGTSDIHLTLVQNVSLTGVIIVTTPQSVALADAVKGLNMFRDAKVNVPVLGIVENMSWFAPAPHPEEKYFIFGKDGGKKFAEDHGTQLLGQIPLVQDIREGGDNGKPIVLTSDSITARAFCQLASDIEKAIRTRNEQLPPTQKVNFSH